MKLLIITQKVDKNDPILGFFHRWILEFAKDVSSVLVICLEKGEYNLPSNVEVLSLGKEKLKAKSYKLKALWNFYKYIWGKRLEYSHIFVHMNPEYVILGGLFWRLMNKKIGLWYVHKNVDLKLKIAERLAHVIFTVAKESFNLKTKKLKTLGHGIDIEYFQCAQNIDNRSNKIKIISIGRLSRIKHFEIFIKAANILQNKNLSLQFEIIGDVVSDDDKKYYHQLNSLVEEYNLQDKLFFRGFVAHSKIKEIYCQSNILVDSQETGGVNKVILEAMSCGVPTIVSNTALTSDFGKYRDNLLFKFRDHNDLAEKILNIINNCPPELSLFLREKITEKHQDSNLIKNILKFLSMAQNDLRESRYFRVLKYIISGGTAAFVNLALLFILTDLFGIWYLSSAVLAFVAAFIVSFLLQKLWTFEDGEMDKINKQLSLYLTIAILNLALNTAILFFLVDIIGLYYIFGQVITSGSIALYSFFVYKHLVFNQDLSYEKTS